jgi:hypothetical protein
MCFLTCSHFKFVASLDDHAFLALRDGTISRQADGTQLLNTTTLLMVFSVHNTNYELKH